MTTTAEWKQRSNFVLKLAQVGLRRGEIAKLLETSSDNVGYAIKQLKKRGQITDDMLGNPNAYMNALQLYRRLGELNANEFDAPLRKMLGEYLKIGALRQFYAGACEAAELFQRPTCPAEMETYRKFCVVVIGRTQIGQDSFDEVLRKVGALPWLPWPHSVREFQQLLARKVCDDALNRDSLAPAAWPHNVAEFINALLEKHLLESQRTTMQYLFGLQCEKLSHQQIAKKLHVSECRVRMLVARAYQKLRGLAGREFRMLWRGTSEQIMEMIADLKMRAGLQQVTDEQLSRMEGGAAVSAFASGDFVLVDGASISLTLMLYPVSELELSVRSGNCLKYTGIKYLGELIQRSETDMLKSKNFGRKSLKEIKEVLASMGLRLGIQIPEWMTRLFREAQRLRDGQ